MNVTEKSRIKTVLRRFPTAEDALGWYGIESDGFDPSTTVDDVAREYQMDVDDLIGDLQAHVEDAKKEGAADDEDFEDDEDDFEDDWVNGGSGGTDGDDIDGEDDTRNLTKGSWGGDGGAQGDDDTSAGGDDDDYDDGFDG